MSNRLALFDCDGTLVDSQHNICTAMKRCFAAERLDPPLRQDIRRVVGLSLPQAMARLLPDAQPDYHDHLAEGYKTAFQTLRAEGLAHEPLFPGIADLLKRLDSEGWLLGVATGKSDRGLGLCLAAHAIAPHFVTLQTADRHPSKPHPAMVLAAMAEAGAEPETTVMIGDTSFDMAMAVNADVRALGVGWGYHDRVELVAAGALSVADTAEVLYAGIVRAEEIA